MSRKLLIFSAIASILYGTHESEVFEETKLPVEYAIKLKPHQKLYEFLPRELVVRLVDPATYNYGTTGVTYSIKNCNPESLYYPAYSSVHAVRHFQRYLDRFYTEKTGHAGPVIGLMMETDSSTGAGQSDILADPDA